MKSLYSKICLYSLLIGGTISCQTEIPDPPEASYTFEVNNIPGASEVTFTNNSSNATDYAWDFGDGGTSNEESPSHTYNSGDRYAVKLIARGDGGSDGVTQDVRVVTSLPAPVADFTIANNNCEAPCTVSFANTSSNASTYTWDFNDGGTATTKDASHRYENAGTYGVKLIASNAVGTSNTKIKEVTIKPKSATPVLTLDFNDPNDVKAWTRQYNTNGNTGEFLSVSNSYLVMRMTGVQNEVIYGLKHSQDLSGLTNFEIKAKFGKEDLASGNPRFAQIKFAVKEYGNRDLALVILYEDGVRKLRVNRYGQPSITRDFPTSCREATFTVSSINGTLTVTDDCTKGTWFTDTGITLAGPVGLDIFYNCATGVCGKASYGSFEIDYIRVSKY
ncbi:PKD domain-containing protein [Salmonirosea aquatica]|uniref:PKD domain-containing protein n=1 Tax=Salmonirosea aquatica TaxID=2654236 RepID=A0A7C9BKW2_9BACT|nr:PKD domain-containing protein [Cytophagaceae bacterium SJW1-29]